MTGRVLIVGASARAAAESARRAGLVPMAIDLFGDDDLRELCDEVRLCPRGDYPAGLPELARELPPAPWLYAGGLESQPGVVAELGAGRELWGKRPRGAAAGARPALARRCRGGAGRELPRIGIRRQSRAGPRLARQAPRRFRAARACAA